MTTPQVSTRRRYIFSEHGATRYVQRSRQQDHRAPNDIVPPLTLAGIANRENLVRMFKRVRSYAGRGTGIDGYAYGDFSITEIGDVAEDFVRAINGQRWRPAPSRRKMIPKPPRGQRQLDIRCHVDRLISSAVAEAVSLALEGIFLPTSFAYRPHRSVHRLLTIISHFVEHEGYRVIGKDDVASAFPSVRINDVVRDYASIVDDPGLLNLIEVILRGYHESQIGIEQGDPLSPPTLNLRLHHCLDLPSSVTTGPDILAAFVAIADQHPDAPIYHYGSYERKALEQMGKASGISVDAVVRRLVNVSTFIFGKVYFPCRSNSLKDLGRFCGAVWKSPDVSGLMSVVWRMQWQASRSSVLKQQLLEYNIDDCNASVILLSELRKIGQSGNARSDVDYADTRKWNTTPSGQQIHDSLEGILKSAHAEYRKNRIGIRQSPAETEASPKKRGAPKGHQAYRRVLPANAGKTVRVKRPISCHRSTAHKGCRLEMSGQIAEHVITDLAFGKGGCRKTVTKYFGTMGYCPQCRLYFPPPAIRRMKTRLFGHCFRAWSVYLRIILRLPYRVITHVLYDLFGEQISAVGIVHFVSDLASYYASTERVLLKKILASPFVHVDETKLNIQGTNHYVWVLTDGKHVVFRLTETRETSLIQQLLNGYTGILICDFYGGYDACVCRQQRCLVHLIRDLNDDLWKNPFNSEFEGFISAVRDLIAPIMADVDKYGLKRRNLQKHQRSVDRFFKKVINNREYKYEITQTDQKRFLRYKDSLFRFLTEDGIPWNNNMAERAIRHLAVQRKISGSFFKRVAEHYLVLLGIAQSCRFQDKPFLRFLLSEQKNVDEFKEKKRLKATELVVRKAGGDVDLTEQLEEQ